MSTETINKPVALNVKAADNRYPIHVEIDGVETFTLYFNPGDPFAIRCADNLSKLEFPTGSDPAVFLEFADSIEKNFDNLFGEGTGQKIFRYESASYTLMTAILDKVKQGQADFVERAKAAEKAAKTQAIIDAKKEGAAYSVMNQA